MTNVKILSEQPITMVELKEELKRIKKRDEELNFRANRTEEYLNMFVTLTDKQAEEMKKKIEDLNIPRLKDEHIVKVIDLLPASEEETKSILSQFTVSVTNDNIKAITDIVAGYL